MGNWQDCECMTMGSKDSYPAGRRPNAAGREYPSAVDCNGPEVLVAADSPMAGKVDRSSRTPGCGYEMASQNFLTVTHRFPIVQNVKGVKTPWPFGSERTQILKPAAFSFYGVAAGFFSEICVRVGW